jgi:hypothetical protein
MNKFNVLGALLKELYAILQIQLLIQAKICVVWFWIFKMNKFIALVSFLKKLYDFLQS